MNIKTIRKRKAIDLIRILGKLVFDSRTQVEHRTNICVVLVRLLNICSTSVTSLLDKKQTKRVDAFVKKVESLLSVQFQYFMGKLLGVGASELKRKNSIRKRRRECNYQGSVWILFDDYEVILPLIKLLSFRESFWSSCHDDFFLRSCSMLLQLETKDDNMMKSKVAEAMQDAPELVYLSTLILMGAWKFGRTQGLRFSIERIQRVILDGISHLCAQLKDNVMPSALYQCLEAIMTMSDKGIPSNLFQHLLHILSLLSCNRTTNIESKFTTAKLLSNTSSAIVASNASVQSLKSVLLAKSSIFASLFKSGEHSLLITTMSAMEKFAVSVPIKHQIVLPNCIPAKNIRSFFECRLKATVFNFSDATKSCHDKFYFDCRMQECMMLSKYYAAENNKKQTWKTYTRFSSEIQIPFKSQVWSLCKGTGRNQIINEKASAVVIFLSESMPFSELSKLQIKNTGSLLNVSEVAGSSYYRLGIE